MGRIRTKLVKSVSEKIYGKNKDRFGKDFKNNKNELDKLAQVNSKKLKNTISGYITKLVKKNKR